MNGRLGFMGGIPGAGRGGNSSNCGEIKWDGGSNIPRIRTRVRNPEVV